MSVHVLTQMILLKIMLISNENENEPSANENEPSTNENEMNHVLTFKVKESQLIRQIHVIF